MKTILFATTVLVVSAFTYAACRGNASSDAEKTDRSAETGIMRYALNDSKPLDQNTIKPGTVVDAETTAIAQTQRPIKSLRTAYRNYFPIGAAVTPETDLLDPATSALIKQQFNSLTAKQAMQPFWIHPQENSYRWGEADMLIKFARENNMKVRGHCLIYALQGHMPKWFYTDSNGQPASEELILQRMKEHIATIVAHFKNTNLYCWDVVNEAISSKSKGNEYFHPEDKLYQIVGEDYVEKAFQYAHEADPKVKLFYNDHFEESNPAKRDKIYRLLKGLKDKGIPVDGIGFQFHIGIDGMSRHYLNESIRLFKSLGLEVQITEADVSIYKLNEKPDQLAQEKDAYTQNIQQTQAGLYDMMFDVCRRNKDAVTGVTFWGTYDNDFERNSMTKRLGKKSYPFLFDSSRRPKRWMSKIVDFDNLSHSKPSRASSAKRKNN